MNSSTRSPGASEDRDLAIRAGIAALFVVGLLACGEAGRERPAIRDERLPAAPAAPPQTDVSTRFRDRIPARELAREGACPFECCRYGTWTLAAALPLLSAPRDGTPVDTLRRAEPFEAETGIAYVTGLQLVIVADTLNEYGERRPTGSGAPEWTPALQPGDTLALLDYVGEGSYRAWHEGQILETQDFWSRGTPVGGTAAGSTIGEYGSEWWVRARKSNGSVGWFRPREDETPQGADACA